MTCKVRAILIDSQLFDGIFEGRNSNLVFGKAVSTPAASQGGYDKGWWERLVSGWSKVDLLLLWRCGLHLELEGDTF